MPTETGHVPGDEETVTTARRLLAPFDATCCWRRAGLSMCDRPHRRTSKA